MLKILFIIDQLYVCIGALSVTHFIPRPLRSYAVTHFIPDRGFTGKMRMRLRIFLCSVYSAKAGLLLRTEDRTPTLGHTNYTQV